MFGASEPPSKSKNSLWAFLLVACVAVVQFVLVLRLANAQFDGAHVIDISGSQRMHTQEIALYVDGAHLGHPERHWRARIESTIAQMDATRAVIRTMPQFASGPIGSDGRTALGRSVDAYFAAARAIERRPDAGAPFEAIRRMRPELVAKFNAAVLLRTHVIDERARRLSFMLLAGLGVQFLTMVLVWRRLLVPAERESRALFLRVSRERDGMLSFFDQNPDAIAVYDRDGILRHSNPARSKLIGMPAEECLGKHISFFMSPTSKEMTLDAFERAKHGRPASTTGGRLKGANGWIDVETTFFPYLIDGERAGVTVVSKDVSSLNAARAQTEVQTKRIAALYEIASAHGRSWQRQLSDALALASSHLGCMWGVVGEVVDGTVEVLATVGEPAGVTVGSAYALDDSLSRFVIAEKDVWEIADSLQSPFHPHPVWNGTGWRSLVAARICVDGQIYGTLTLASAEPRAMPLREMDRDFVRVVSALLGSIIERGRHEKKLDTLAYFDALTGLPNRMLVHEKIDEMIVAARRNARRFAIYFVDLDRFKLVNDTGGHAVGDEVLRIVARRLQGCVREADLVARLGGDEFVIVQSSLDAEAGGGLVERLTAAIERPFAVNGRSYRLGCSVGVGYYPEDGLDAQRLLARADMAMYRAKMGGRLQLAAGEPARRVPSVDGGREREPDPVAVRARTEISEQTA